MKDKIAENAGFIVEVSNRATYGGAGVAVISGFSLNEWAAAIGIVVAVLTYVTNVVFKIIERRDRLTRMGPPKQDVQ